MKQSPQKKPTTLLPHYLSAEIQQCLVSFYNIGEKSANVCQPLSRLIHEFRFNALDAFAPCILFEGTPCELRAPLLWWSSLLFEFEFYTLWEALFPFINFDKLNFNDCLTFKTDPSLQESTLMHHFLNEKIPMKIINELTDKITLKHIAHLNLNYQLQNTLLEDLLNFYQKNPSALVYKILDNLSEEKLNNYFNHLSLDEFSKQGYRQTILKIKDLPTSFYQKIIRLNTLHSIPNTTSSLNSKNDQKMPVNLFFQKSPTVLRKRLEDESAQYLPNIKAIR